MIASFLGHRIIITKLDDVPPGLRVNAAVLVVTQVEAEALGMGDPVVTAQMRAIVNMHDRAYLEQTLRRRAP